MHSQKYVKRAKALLASFAVITMVIAQPLAACAWTWNAQQQQIVNNMLNGREALLVGDYTQAKQCMNNILQLDSYYASAYYYRALAYQYEGNAGAAAADYGIYAQRTGDDEAKSLSLQLGARKLGSSVLSATMSSVISSAQVTDEAGNVREMTEQEKAAVRGMMQGGTDAADEAYMDQYGDKTDHAKYKNLLACRDAVYASTEERYDIDENQVVCCGMGRTAICFDSSDIVVVEEETADPFNPFSPIIEGRKEKITDRDPVKENAVYILSAPYTSIEVNRDSVTVYVPKGTQIVSLYEGVRGTEVEVFQSDFTMRAGERDQYNLMARYVKFTAV